MIFRTIYWEEFSPDQQTGEMCVRPFRYRVGQKIKYNRKDAFIGKINQIIIKESGTVIVEIWIKNLENEMTLLDRFINPKGMKIGCDVEQMFEEK